MTAVISSPILQLETPALVQDEPLYEIIDGQRVELPPMSILANRVASRLMSKLGSFLEANPLGEALMETLLHLPLPADRNRRPDLAYISAQRIGQALPQPGSDNAWDVVPELMVEVISPHDLAEETIERLLEYFRAGAKLVWIVYPTARLIHIYEGPKHVRILDHADDLDGGAVLPGFRVPIVALFPE